MEATNVTGSCGKENQTITVHLGEKSVMTLRFTSDTTTTKYMLSEIYLFIDVSNEFKGNYAAYLTFMLIVVILLYDPIQRVNTVAYISFTIKY